MAHTLYVDLSAKVDHWTKDSAVAVSNDGCHVFLASGKVKQKARLRIRSRHGEKSEQYRLLAALIYVAISTDLPTLAYVVIDQDYSGAAAEATIKNFLLELLHRDRADITSGFIRFAKLRGTRADRMAKRVYDGKTKPDHNLKFSELEDLL